MTTARHTTRRRAPVEPSKDGRRRRSRAAPSPPAEDRLLTDDERVDLAGQESFPASDAPAWTLGTDRTPGP